MKKSLLVPALAGLIALAVQTKALADDGVCPCQVAVAAGEPRARPMLLGNAGPSFVKVRPQPVKAVLARLRVLATAAKTRSFFRPKP